MRRDVARYAQLIEDWRLQARPPQPYNAHVASRSAYAGWLRRGRRYRSMAGHMAGRILALDIGAKRIGVAVSDELGLLATPRAVILRRSTDAALDEIVRLARAEEASLVVVGLPISLDGQLHSQARTVQRFGERLRKRLEALQIPLVYADEMLSTVRAEERLRAAGVRSNRIRERIDAEAAAVILEEYLDQRRQAERAERRAAEHTRDENEENETE